MGPELHPTPQVVSKPHHTLVTLLLCNAFALEVRARNLMIARLPPLCSAADQAGILQALPIFLDRLVDPVTAVVLSVTVVLFFGELHPALSVESMDNFLPMIQSSMCALLAACVVLLQVKLFHRPFAPIMVLQLEPGLLGLCAS